jgi:hypothetical protein
MSEKEQPFYVGWYLQNSVLYAHIERTLIGDEGTNFNQTMIEHIRAGNPPVFLIADLRHLKMETTPRVSALRKTGNYRAEPNLRWMISVIDDDKVLNFAIGTATQSSGTSYTSVTSLEDAVAFIHERMPNWDWDAVNETVFLP